MRSKNDYWDYLEHSALYHHGVLGMKWGIRKDRYSGIPRNAKTKNLDKWGKSKNTNVLYITGQSGSGKSYIADNMKDKRTHMIHLDSYFDDPKGPRDKAFDSYMNKNFKDYKRLSASVDEISFDDWKKIANKFEKHIEGFGADQYSKGDKVIVEGVHLLDPDDLWVDKSFFNNKPTMVLKTNTVKSNYRAIKRDKIKLTPTEIINRTQNSIEWNNEINQFVKGAGM